jgi:hypothetical protein
MRRGPLARRRRSSSFLVFSFLRAKLVDSDIESEPTPSIKMSQYCTYRTQLHLQGTVSQNGFGFG